MNICDTKNRMYVNAIKFCLNFNGQIKLIGVDYKSGKDIYKCRVIDHQFGGRVTVRLNGDFVRSAVKRVLDNKPLIWYKEKLYV
jgi:CHASE2 domain-containing sensor protein